MKNLKIKQKWIELILSGKKTWEIRRQKTNITGLMGLGYREKRYGTAYLMGCEKFSIDELVKHFDEHQVPEIELRKYVTKGGKTHGFAWFLKDARRTAVKKIPRAYSARAKLARCWYSHLIMV